MKPEIGTSFSLHYCTELGLSKKQVLRAAIDDLGIKRFRLMSYWNIHEPKPGKYDFSELDWQMDMVARAGAKVSLCVGKRQPRWPECHIPDWALELPKEHWYEALYHYVGLVVQRYRDHPALHSWQLENEAFLKSFGECRDGDFNRGRIRREMKIIRHYDPQHQVIMTLSGDKGLPIFGPIPDKFGLTIYPIVTDPEGNYKHLNKPAWRYKLKAMIIKGYSNRDTFIHELQAEPWANKPLIEVPLDEQDKSMNPGLLRENFDFALKTKLTPPIYLWGMEWWYWRKHIHDDSSMWNAAKELVSGFQR